MSNVCSRGPSLPISAIRLLATSSRNMSGGCHAPMVRQPRVWLRSGVPGSSSGGMRCNSRCRSHGSVSAAIAHFRPSPTKHQGESGCGTRWRRTSCSAYGCCAASPASPQWRSWLSRSASAPTPRSSAWSTLSSGGPFRSRTRTESCLSPSSGRAKAVGSVLLPRPTFSTGAATADRFRQWLLTRSFRRRAHTI